MLCSVEHGTKNRSMRATEAVNQSAIRDLSSNKQTMKQANKQKKRRRRRLRRRQSQDRQRANNWADLEEVFAAVWGYAITSSLAILLCSDAPMLSQATNELNSIIRPSKLMAASAEPGLCLVWRKLGNWETTSDDLEISLYIVVTSTRLVVVAANNRLLCLALSGVSRVCVCNSVCVCGVRE